MCCCHRAFAAPTMPTMITMMTMHTVGGDFVCCRMLPVFIMIQGYGMWWWWVVIDAWCNWCRIKFATDHRFGMAGGFRFADIFWAYSIIPPFFSRLFLRLSTTTTLRWTYMNHLMNHYLFNSTIWIYLYHRWTTTVPAITNIDIAYELIEEPYLFFNIIPRSICQLFDVRAGWPGGASSASLIVRVSTTIFHIQRMHNVFDVFIYRPVSISFYIYVSYLFGGLV